MLYKILFIAGLIFLLRMVFKNLKQVDQMKQQQRPKKPDDDTFDAEYTVVDDDKQER